MKDEIISAFAYNTAKEIENINRVLEAYFTKNNNTTIIPVKELMPEFIAAGIFTKDVKNGKPIRDVLKQLQKENTLDQIPYVHAMQNGDDTYWYFIPKNAAKPTTTYKKEEISKLLPSRFSLKSLTDYQLFDDINETGLTFEENAKIKTKVKGDRSRSRSQGKSKTAYEHKIEDTVNGPKV